MKPPQVALSARVSSAQQAAAHTVARQVAAWRARGAADGLTVSEAMPCLEAGESGATLVRPALARWRAVIAAGRVDRLSGHAPARLARQYAYPVLLVDECRRAGGEGICLNRALGQRPADALLRHVQGMSAAYARAKSIARHRRGQRQAAHVGGGHVLRGAPSGSRDVTTYEGGRQGRDELLPDAGRVVRQVLAWGGCDRRTLGEVGRRLPPAGERTRTGTTVWERRVVWGLLPHPASPGAAAFGQTRLEPRRPRLRAQRHRPVPPRRAVSVRAGPPEDWSTLPGPALVEPEGCAAVQEPLREHQRQARPPARRGAWSLLHGVRPGQPCGSAFDGKRRSPSARQGQPRADASARGLGTAAYRCGGERLGQQTQVRTDLRALAVWQDVCPLVTHPERRAEEDRRRLQPETRAQRTPLATLADPISKVRQGVARLIDRDAERLMDQSEFAPRMPRRRPRLARLEEQRQAWAEEAAWHGELPLLIGRLEDCAPTLHDGLETADWASQRDLIRALVKRVEVARHEGKVVCRSDPYPGENDPEKKRWQLCRGRAQSRPCS
jgi:site-specific DNA recombinase